MGSSVDRIMRMRTGKYSQLLLDFTGGRSAIINIYLNTDTPYSASVTTATETKYISVDPKKMFVCMTENILDLFEKNKPNIKKEESLIIRKILDKANEKEVYGKFINL